MFMNEFTEEEQDELLEFFEQNKMLILLDIVKGRGKFAAEWILVAQKYENVFRWTLKPINVAINHYREGAAVIVVVGVILVGMAGIVVVAVIEQSLRDVGNGVPLAVLVAVPAVVLFGVIIVVAVVVIKSRRGSGAAAAEENTQQQQNRQENQNLSQAALTVKLRRG